MGVGGGLFANLLMTFYGRPIHQAIATSSALAVLISIPGALGYVYAGWPAAVRVFRRRGAAAAVRAWLCLADRRAAGDADERWSRRRSASGSRMRCRSAALEMAFGAYLFIVGGRFVISLLNGAIEVVESRRELRRGFGATQRGQLLRVNIGVGIPQDILLHLAHGVARQFVDDEDALRQLEFRQPAVERLQIDRVGDLGAGCRTTTAVTPSPKSGCGTPITALSITPGKASISLSISFG